MSEPKIRPRGISETALALLTILIQGWTSVQWRIGPDDSLTYYLVSLLLFIAFGVAVIWLYWRGHNWARRVVLAYSVLSLWFSTRWDWRYFKKWDLSWLSAMRLLSLVELIFFVYLLYWLNTDRILDFFAKSNVDSSRNSFLNILKQIVIWASGVLFLLFGILMALASTFVKYGLSRAGLLVLSFTGPLILASLLVFTYYKIRRERRTLRRVVFYVAAWTFAFGYWLITREPVRQWFIYHEGASITQWQNISYQHAEQRFMWEVSVAEKFGSASPLLAASLEHAADFYRERNQEGKAEPLYRRSAITWDAAGMDSRAKAIRAKYDLQ